MPELELTRSPGDRHLYVLDGVGTLRVGGWLSRGATAEAGSDSWQLGRRGMFKAAMQATDAAGGVAGEFEGRALRRGGTLRWDGREYELRPSSMWRERYALADGERELATIEGKGWGKRPVKVTVEDGAGALEPGLLLFAAYVVRALAEDAAAASSAAAGGAATAGSN
jgi:hypothetical protein